MADLLPVGEIARRSGVASSALRFYEQRGLNSSERAGSGSGALTITRMRHRRSDVEGAPLVQLASLDAANAMSWTARSLDKTSVLRTRSYSAGSLQSTL